jgi:hypothetical protein
VAQQQISPKPQHCPLQQSIPLSQQVDTSWAPRVDLHGLNKDN